MDLSEYLNRQLETLSFRDAIEIWREAVRAVQDLSAGEGFHNHLQVSSFAIDLERGPSSMRVAEAGSIARAAGVGRRRAFVRAWRLAAPEQTILVRAPCGPATNVYNLGVLGYLLVSKRTPFEGHHGAALVEAIVKEPLPAVRVNEISASEETLLNRIIARATAKRPDERYQSIPHLGAELSMLAASTSSGGMPPRLPLIGRDDVIGRLSSLFAEARTGTAATLFITGEAGMGKSFLMRSVAAAESREGERWAYFKAPQTGEIPYAGIAVLLDELLRLDSERDLEQLSRMLVEDDVSQRAIRMGAALLPRLAEVLGAESSVNIPRIDTRLEDIESELAALIRTLVASAELTVIVADDLQWIDEQSMRVLSVLLRDTPSQMAIILLGRPEAQARIPRDLQIETLQLTGLSEQHTLSLLERMLRPNEEEMEPLALNQQIQRRARGNPLVTVNLLQMYRGGRPHLGVEAPDLWSGAGGEPWRPGSPEGEILEELAGGRLEEVSRDCRFLLCYVSLLLPPVPIEMITATRVFDRSTIEALLTESEEALLLDIDWARGQVRFSHDSIETIARRAALSDPNLVRRATQTLLAAAKGGNERASFALAGLLVEGHATDTVENDRSLRGEDSSGQRLESSDAIHVLQRAAARALELVMPSDARRFAEAAVKLADRVHEKGGELDETLLSLHLIAHEASYLLDDVGAMSRHFMRVQALGSSLDTNEARQRWITRAYAKSKFSNAIKIGWRIVVELGAIDREADYESIRQQASRFLSRSQPRTVYRRLLRCTQAPDRLSMLIVQTCALLMLPSLTIDRERLPVLIYLIFSEGFSKGRSGYDGIAFVWWAQFEVIRGASQRLNRKIMDCALELADRTDDDLVRHTVLTFAGVLVRLSRREYPRHIEELPHLYREGVRLANFEFAAHALHIHAQGLFYLGRPLGEVFETMGDYHKKLLEIHYDRTAKTLDKFQQAVECLMGQTTDVLELTGSVCNEDEYWAGIERDGDAMSIAGFHILKAMLATFEDKPVVALRHCRLFGEVRRPVAGLYESFYGYFLWGLCAFRARAMREGNAVLQQVRNWMGESRENHEHRYLALRAERAAAHGGFAQAVRLFGKAKRLCLARGYPSEAALFSEREGDLLRLDPSKAHLAAEPLHLAQSLYAQWGAAPAAERVRRKLNWAEMPMMFNPVLTDEAFLTRMTSSPSIEGFSETLLDQISRHSAASEAHLWVGVLGKLSFSSRWIDGMTGQGRQQGRSPTSEPEVEKLLGSAEPGARTMERFLAENGHARPALVYRTDPSPSISIRVCLLGASGAPVFSSFVTSRVSAAVLLAASILQLREAVFAEARQTKALETTQEELARTQEYSRVLFGTLPDAMLLVDGSLKVLFHNRSSECYVVDGAGGPTRFEEGVERIVQRAVTEAHEGSGVGEVESRWRDAVLSVMVIQPQFSTNQEPLKIFAVTIRDVTEVKRQEEELRRKEQQLIIADRMASIGMFSSSIAHEVSNPNHILKLNAQSLAMLLEQWWRAGGSVNGAAIDEAREIVEKIAEGTRRIEGVVDQVKEYGREGRRTVWEAVDPGEVCERALRFSRIMASQYTKHLVYERRREGPPILGDRGQLEQAVINLIKNACEALDTVDGTVKVSVEYSDGGETASIMVADTGPGIDASIVDMLGEPFSTTRAGNGGTGLGLSIVRTIAERHNGRFSFAVGEGFNTIARLTIPTMSQVRAEKEAL